MISLPGSRRLRTGLLLFLFTVASSTLTLAQSQEGATEAMGTTADPAADEQLWDDVDEFQDIIGSKTAF